MIVEPPKEKKIGDYRSIWVDELQQQWIIIECFFFVDLELRTQESSLLIRLLIFWSLSDNSCWIVIEIIQEY
jgi:hypothetical protein